MTRAPFIVCLGSGFTDAADDSILRQRSDLTPEPCERRSQIRIAPFGGRSWSRAQRRARIFFRLLRLSSVSPTDYKMSQPGRSPL